MHSATNQSQTRLTNRQRLRFDAVQMQSSFDKTPFLITHDLTDDRLFELPRLIELSTALPEESVEYNAGDLAVNQAPALTPRTGLSIDQTLQNIERCNSWMVLKNVEQHAQYRRVMDECLDQIESSIDGVSPGMVARKAFIFVSSPRAVTPYHVDFEHNFLLQVRGSKVMTVFDPQDRTLLSEVDRERAVAGAPRNLPYRDEFATKGCAFAIAPGVGVHVPLSSPHWVNVGDDVSVSFSITFHSTASARTIGTHKTNALLRRTGVTPRQVGESRIIDTLKYTTHRVLRRLEATTNRFGKSGSEAPT